MDPGEIYWVDFPTGRRPGVVVSRPQLNRGQDVVVVPITSAKFANRVGLPNCVPFYAGDFGLARDRVAQAELVGSVPVVDVDVAAGLIGQLDEANFRLVTRAVGYVMSAECEPE